MWPLRSTTCNIALKFYHGDFPRKAAEGIVDCVQWNKERGGREDDQLVMADILYTYQGRRTDNESGRAQIFDCVATVRLWDAHSPPRGSGGMLPQKILTL